ncbi:MAG: hypothetical protein ABFC90_03265 [Bacteroidales bacterium]|nr:hypothetical protein [Bacteroidales bacterium]
MKPFFKSLILYVLSLTAFSCSDAKLLQKGLSQYSEHLGYEFTSPISKGPKADSLVVIFNHCLTKVTEADILH